LPFRRTRHDGNQFGRFENLRNGERQSAHWNLLKGSESAVMDLLAAADFVESHYLDLGWVTEITVRWIDKGQVSIPQHRKIRRMLLQSRV
jgi:hypothetical protein